MEAGGEDALEELRHVFNLCDSDQDGVISVDDFRSIGREHFDKTKPMEVLIQQIDPEGSGHITFTMFRAGITSFLTSRSIRSRSTSQCSSNVDVPHSPTELASLSEVVYDGDSVHPLFPNSHPVVITNGYSTDCSGSSGGCELTHCLSGDGEADVGTPLHSSPIPLRRQSLPLSSNRDSPSLLGRVRLTRHSQLAIPPSPGSVSKSSTPAELEAEEVVYQLNDQFVQLLDLSSKLEHLEEDHKTSHGARERLRREKEELEARMEEYEEQIRSTEQLSQRMLQENAERQAVTMNRLRRESQAQLDDLTAQLQACKDDVNQLQSSETNLKTQLTTATERLEEYQGCVCALEEKERERREEVRRGREQLRTERAKWDREREAHTQVVQESEGQIKQWRRMYEEARKEKKRRSLTVSDMDTEVLRLSKEVEKLKRDNDQLQARFLQQGKELISQKVQSLADEMEDASKDDVMKVLRDTELHNARLHEYIEGLLVTIIDNHPELLEKR